MAKEGDEIKKIELKVSVSCCIGCKRRVKRILQKIEGVLKTDIHPVKPKVTVLGKVDPHILIRKLSKGGKHAELISLNMMNIEKESGPGTERVKEQPLPDSIMDDPLHPDTETSDKDREDEIQEKALEKEDNEKVKDSNIASNKASKKETDLISDKTPDLVIVESFRQQLSMAESCPVAIPYYTVPAYRVPVYSMRQYGEDDYAYRVPFYSMRQYGEDDYFRRSPAAQPPVARVGDYFSDDNTIGCNVM